MFESKDKFLTYFYVQIGWNCSNEIMLKVIDLTQLEIDKIKENWFLYYNIYIFKDRRDDDTEEDVITFPILEEFFMCGAPSFYDYIKDDVEVLLENNATFNINFNKLYEMFFGSSNEFSKEFDTKKMYQLYYQQEKYLISLYNQLKSLNLVDKECPLFNKY